MLKVTGSKDIKEATGSIFEIVLKEYRINKYIKMNNNNNNIQL